MVEKCPCVNRYKIILIEKIYILSFFLTLLFDMGAKFGTTGKKQHGNDVWAVFGEVHFWLLLSFHIVAMGFPRQSGASPIPWTDPPRSNVPLLEEI